MSVKRPAALCVLGVLLAGVVVGLVLYQASNGTALGQGKGGAAASPRYTVVETEGHNLIVTDNQKNTLYFYTVNKEAPVGSPLYLRGSVDLTQVGGATITPTKSAKFQGGK